MNVLLVKQCRPIFHLTHQKIIFNIFNSLHILANILSLVPAYGLYYWHELFVLHNPRMKTVYLSSVSGYALMVAQRPNPVCNHQNTRGVYVLFASLTLWLRAWMAWLSGRPQLSAVAKQEHQTGNRHERRIAHRRIPPARNLGALYRLFGRGISRRQFMERLCALSILGRVSIYKFQYWGSVLQRRALLQCYDHGWWRAPIGDFGRLYCGVWPIYLWVDWRKLPSWQAQY